MLDASPRLESMERRQLRDTVRSIVERHLPEPVAREADETGAFPRPMWQALGAAGLLGIGAPEESGGVGGSAGDSVAVVEEISRVLPALAVDYALCGMAMRMLGQADERAAARWMPALARGEMLCAYGMSEPDAGTDLLALRTTATETADGWVLNGQKLWTSLAQEADLIFVVARTDEAPAGRRATGLSVIAVPRDQPGVTVRRVHLAGMRAAVTCEVFLDGAVAPLANLVGRRGEAMRLLSTTLDLERVLAATISLGIGRAALDLHVEHARTRYAFGRPIGAFQAVQHPAADSVTELTAARALIDLAVAAIEQGHDARHLAVMAKLNAAEVTARVVDRGMRAMGAMGLAAESRMQMLFRDARLGLFSPISNEMIRNILGEALGLPRSY